MCVYFVMLYCIIYNLCSLTRVEWPIGILVLRRGRRGALVIRLSELEREKARMLRIILWLIFRNVSFFLKIKDFVNFLVLLSTVSISLSKKTGCY